MKITRRQLRRIIKEELLREAVGSGILWFEEGSLLYNEIIAFDENRPQIAPSWAGKSKSSGNKGPSFLQEANGGVWLTSVDAFKHEVDGADFSYFEDARKSVCTYKGPAGTEAAAAMDMPFAPDGATWLSADEKPPIRKKWGLIAQACREGRPLSGELENMIAAVFAGARSRVQAFLWIIGRLTAMDLTGLSEPGYTGCWDPKSKDGPRKKKRSKPGPHLESGSIDELMDLDYEEFPEVDGLVADFGTLSSAQKKALSKIEDMGYGDASVADFKNALKQVGPQNFLTAFDAVSSAISEIEFGSADTLYSFYSEVAELAEQ